MNERLELYLSKLIGCKLLSMSLVAQMIVMDFGEYGLHSQCLTRICKNGDILFTTYDYQSWDEKIDTNNDEWYFYNLYKDGLVNGIVENVEFNQRNDLSIFLSNGVLIEIFISNGYFHYEDELEQYRLLIDRDKDKCLHVVVYNKHIEFER